MRKPVWIELNGVNVLVVGGGSVGTRRALWFLEGGANVTVVAKEHSVRLRELAGKNPRLKLVVCDARECSELGELVKWADIVVIAVADQLVRDRVWSLAKSMRKLVNDATDAEKTQIVIPYYGEVFSGGIKIATTSEGLAGVAARHALYTAIACLESDEKLRIMFEVFKRVKKLLKKHVALFRQRMEVYMEVEKILLTREFKSVDEALKEVAMFLAERLGKPVDWVTGELNVED